MGKILILLITMLFVSFSQAGIGGCIAEQSTLTCKSYSSTTSTSTSTSKNLVAGPDQQAQVEDIQPEPFEFSVCQAAIALNTEAGKFVAIYDADSSSLRSWINVNGKDISIVKEAFITKSEALTLTYQNPNQPQSYYKFICAVN